MLGGSTERYAVGCLPAEFCSKAGQMTTSLGQLRQLVTLWLSGGKPRTQGEQGNTPSQFKRGFSLCPRIPGIADEDELEPEGFQVPSFPDNRVSFFTSCYSKELFCSF